MIPLDHIGIATHNGEAVDDLLKRLSHSTASVHEDIDSQEVRVRLYGKDTKLETIQPLSADSTVARHLSKRGEGLHHIAFRVASAQAELDRMRESGFQPLTEKPVPGAGGKQIFFLHPRDTCGILVEFCQPAKQYAVQFEACDQLEQQLQLTGHCMASDTYPAHRVTGGPLPKRGQSLVVHNVSTQLAREKHNAPAVPVLISDITPASAHAQALHTQWPKARLVILPESVQHNLLPAVLLDFWASVENE